MRNRLEKVNKLRAWVQQEFDVKPGEDLVLLANLLADAILFTDITIMQKTFGKNQSNRLALRKLRSAFKVLKMQNFLKYEGD